MVDKLYALALSQSASGEFGEMLSTLTQALQHGPDDPRVLKALGHQLCALGRWDEAVPVLRRALSRTPASLSAGVLITLAFALGNTAKFEESLAAADRAIERAPDSGAARFHRAAALAALGRHSEAIDAYLRAIELGLPPGFAAAAHTNLGLSLRAAGRVREAIAHFRRALRLDPNDPNSYSGLGSALWHVGETGASIAALRHWLTLRPDEPMALNLLAWVLATAPGAGLRDPGEAVELARKAVRLAPAEMRWAFLNTLGVALYRAGRHEEAIEALLASTRLRGENAHDGLFLAMACFRLGREAEAREWYERSVRLIEADPSDDPELERFRAEAEALLAAPRKRAPLRRKG
jgi:tetratricopeptide (TPR) repeat protein